MNNLGGSRGGNGGFMGGEGDDLTQMTFGGGGNSFEGRGGLGEPTNEHDAAEKERRLWQRDRGKKVLEAARQMTKQQDAEPQVTESEEVEQQEVASQVTESGELEQQEVGEPEYRKRYAEMKEGGATPEELLAFLQEQLGVSEKAVLEVEERNQQIRGMIDEVRTELSSQQVTEEAAQQDTGEGTQEEEVETELEKKEGEAEPEEKSGKEEPEGTPGEGGTDAGEPEGDVITSDDVTQWRGEAGRERLASEERERRMQGASEKMLRSKKLKRWANRVKALVGAALVALGITVAAVGGPNSTKEGAAGNATPPVGDAGKGAVDTGGSGQVGTSDALRQEAEAIVNGTTYGEEASGEETSGEEESFDFDDAYSRPELYASTSKITMNAFSDGKAVEETCKSEEGVEHDAVWRVEYVAQQREALAAYVFYFPDELRRDEDKGIESSVDLAEKYDGLSNEEFSKVYDYYCDEVLEKHTRVREDTVTGMFSNVYMYRKNADAKLDHNNIELARCNKAENGTAVYVMEFVDSAGNVIRDKNGEAVTMTVKRACYQPIHKEGTKVDKKTVVLDSKPTPPKEETPVPEQTPEKGPEAAAPGTPPPVQEETPAPEQTPEKGPEAAAPGTPPEDEGTQTPTPDPTPKPKPTPTPEPEELAPKDKENAERVDDSIFEDLADDVNTGKVNVEQTPSEEVESQKPTDEPSKEEYPGVNENGEVGSGRDQIVENEAAQGKTTGQGNASAESSGKTTGQGNPSGGWESPTPTPPETFAPENPENDYSTNRDETLAEEDRLESGTNQNTVPEEEIPNKVEEDKQAQDEANQKEMSPDEVPNDVGEDLDNVLNGFGL